MFIKENGKITVEVYQNFFKTIFFPWPNKIYVPGTFVFQQGGTPVHTSRSTMAFLNAETMEFWMPSMCSPSNPDQLNPRRLSHHSDRDRMVSNVNNHRHTSLVALKRTTKRSWNGKDENYIKNVVGSLRRRLERVIEGDDAYIQ